MPSDERPDQGKSSEEIVEKSLDTAQRSMPPSDAPPPDVTDIVRNAAPEGTDDQDQT